MNNTSRVLKWLHIILFIFIILLGLQAAYIGIIGGVANFFWFSMGLLSLTLLSSSPSTIKKLIASIIFLALALYFSLTQSFIFLTALLLSYIVCFIWPKSSHYQTFKIMTLFTVLIFSYFNQQAYLKQLKDQYKLHDSGETWQQSGAL